MVISEDLTPGYRIPGLIPDRVRAQRRIRPGCVRSCDSKGPQILRGRKVAGAPRPGSADGNSRFLDIPF